MMTQPIHYAAAPPVIAAFKAGCAGCGMHQMCLPMGLGQDDTAQLDQIVGHRRVARDERLYGRNEIHQAIRDTCRPLQNLSDQFRRRATDHRLPYGR